MRKVLDELHRAETISEVLLLSTCNRVEVYADVARFHPAVAEISTVLSRHAGLSVADLSEHLYVHFAEAAVEHMFSVASGLDSMVVGESQILGQLRSAYALGTEVGVVGTVLHDLAQTALRVGKRVHTRDRHRPGGCLDRLGRRSTGADRGARRPLESRRALIVGAGSMGALAGATLRRRGAHRHRRGQPRRPSRAARLAASLGGRAVALAEVAARDRRGRPAGVAQPEPPAWSSRATRSRLAPAGRWSCSTWPAPRRRRRRQRRWLASPIWTWTRCGSDGAVVSDAEVAAAAAIVADELRDYLAEQQRLAVAPTVTALRARANQVIDAELTRLDGRLPGLDVASARARWPTRCAAPSRRCCTHRPSG